MENRHRRQQHPAEQQETVGKRCESYNIWRSRNRKPETAGAEEPNQHRKTEQKQVVWRRNDTLITPPTTIFYMGAELFGFLGMKQVQI
jgi:hypothetical protein